MAFIPMAAALAAHLERVPTGRLVKAAALSLAALACAVGLPARLLVTGLEWDVRDAGAVDRFVASHVHKTDWVFSEYESYYSAKKSAGIVLLPFAIGRLSLPGSIVERTSQAERDRVNVVITKPDAEEATLRYFGGEWRCIARYEAEPTGRASLTARLGAGGAHYALSIHRREPTPLVAGRVGD